jgi:hypothetical protein
LKIIASFYSLFTFCMINSERNYWTRCFPELL